MLELLDFGEEGFEGFSFLGGGFFEGVEVVEGVIEFLEGELIFFLEVLGDGLGEDLSAFSDLLEELGGEGFFQVGFQLEGRFFEATA